MSFCRRDEKRLKKQTNQTSLQSFWSPATRETERREELSSHNPPLLQTCCPTEYTLIPLKVPPGKSCHQREWRVLLLLVLTSAVWAANALSPAWRLLETEKSDLTLNRSAGQEEMTFPSLLIIAPLVKMEWAASFYLIESNQHNKHCFQRSVVHLIVTIVCLRL